MIKLTHKEIATQYREGKLKVYIDKASARRFVLGPYADPHNKPAEYFWSFIAVLFTFLLPIPLIFWKGWWWAISSVVIGIIIWNAERKTSTEFVMQNMMEDPKFMRFVLFNKGAKIESLDGEIIDFRATED